MDVELEQQREVIENELEAKLGTPEEEIQWISAGEQWTRYKRYPYLLAKLLFFGLVGFIFLWVLTSVSSVAFPVFVSLFLAYLLNPTIARLEGHRFNRSLGILMCIVAGTVFIAAFLIFLYPTIATQVERLLQGIPRLIEATQTRFIPWVEQTLGFDMPPTLAEGVAQYRDSISDAFPAIAQHLSAWATGVVTRTTAVVVSILNLVMIPIFTFYFLRDFEKMRDYTMRFLPPKKNIFLLARIRLMDEVVGQWFRGQLQVSGILAILYAIGLAFVFGISGLGVQSGIAIGLLTGILNVIPYFGFAVGSLLAVLVTLTDWTGWGPLIGVIITYTVIQLVESYYITPKVVGDKVGLKPITVIIVLLLGGQLAGLLGVLLAIPIAGAIKVLLPDLIDWYERSPMFTGAVMTPTDSVYGTPHGVANASAEKDGSIGVMPAQRMPEVEKDEQPDVNPEPAAPKGAPPLPEDLSEPEASVEESGDQVKLGSDESVEEDEIKN